MKLSKKIMSLGLVVSMIAISAPNVNALSSTDKIQGKDKYEIAAKIADKQSYTTAIVVNADSSIADGLSASGLSGTVDAPILLTNKNVIPDSTLSRIIKAKKVYIIGGLSSVSQKVENELKSKGIEVKRIGGNDRIQTSYNVAKEINGIKKVNKVMLTNAYKGEPDAMSIAPVAVRDDAPIVLTNGNTAPTALPFNVKSTESYVIGGVNSMTNKLVQDTNSTRLGGQDRYGTNKLIINKFYPNAKEFYVTRGLNLVDALVTAPIAKNTPTVLAEKGSDKSVLLGATKLTFVGNVDSTTMQQCIDASNNVKVDQYTDEMLVAELKFVEAYMDGLNKVINIGEKATYEYAKQVDSTLVQVYNTHLSLKSDNVIYKEMQNTLYNMMMLNKALLNKDIKTASTWLDKTAASVEKVEKLVSSRSSVKDINIPELNTRGLSNKEVNNKVVNDAVQKVINSSEIN